MEPKNLENQVQLNHLAEEQVEQAIRDASRSWSAEEWEQYLKTLEVGLKESQPELSADWNLILAANIFELAPATCSDDISALLKKLVCELTEKQKFVIEKYFFEGRSERQIARMMLISRSGVVDLKKRAIRQLEKKAIKALSALPLWETGDPESQLNEEARESLEKGESSC